MRKVEVLQVEFDNLTMDEAVQRGLDCIAAHKGGYVVTPNPEIVMLARENQALAGAVAQAELVLPDGIGVIYGAKILGRPLQQKVAGIEFGQNLMAELAKQHGSVYLFGAKPGVAEKAGENLQQMFPGLQLAGTSDGYFQDDRPIVEKINTAAPDLLLVCLGAPKQELWMQDHAGELNVGLMAGLGGSLDVFSGTVQRAPEIWCKLGLEWLYRGLSDPKRMGRLMKLPHFVLCVLKERVTHG